MEYPTYKGIAICTQEIWLPETNLNPEKAKNYNNHHNEWTARMFGRSILLQVIRDLEAQQEYLPKDVHSWIHENYDPPKEPTPYEAMDRIEQAFWEQEKLRFRQKGQYILRDVDCSIYEMCEDEYNNFK